MLEQRLLVLYRLGNPAFKNEPLWTSFYKAHLKIDAPSPVCRSDWRAAEVWWVQSVYTPPQHR